MKKIIFLIIGFYLLTLFQTSFFLHFFFGYWLNLVLIAIVLINFLETEKEKLGLFLAFFAGFFLDIFSENFFGFWILILLSISTFIKFVFKKNVQVPSLKGT